MTAHGATAMSRLNCHSMNANVIVSLLGRLTFSEWPDLNIVSRLDQINGTLQFIEGFLLFWPGKVEGFFAVVGINMAVEEGAVASAAELIARWCVMKTCDSIPERSDTIGAGFN